MNVKSSSVLFALAILAGCAGAPRQAAKDRFALAEQSDVYLIHRTTNKPFLIENTGYSAFTGGGGIVAGGAQLAQFNESRTLQKKFNLEDPAPYARDHLAASLRDSLGLSNLRILPEAASLPTLAQDVEPQDWQRTGSPGGSSAAPSETFRHKHPTGIAIEVMTQHWGMDNYKIKYYASARVVDLAASKVLLSTHCTWVTFDQVDAKELTAMNAARAESDGSASAESEEEVRDSPRRDRRRPARHNRDRRASQDAAAARGRPDQGGQGASPLTLEAAIYADNGAVMKASLQMAAEFCAEKIAVRFIGADSVGPAR